MWWAALASVAVSLLSKGGGGGGTPPAVSRADGGYASSYTDHSNWNVQIGSGLNVGPAGLAELLVVGGVALVVWSSLNKKP